MANPVAQVQEVIWRRIGDDIVVIKDDGLSTHVLNKTAAIIWELCDGRNGTGEIAARLCQRFEVSYEQALADVLELIGKLVQVGIMKNGEETSS